MKNIVIQFWLLLIIPYSYCQEDGGMLCGLKTEKPVWIMRFQVIDKETHEPIRYADISVFKTRGDGFKWHSDRNGIAVLVVTREPCIPEQGTIEITARDYAFFSQPINQSYFSSNESNYRIILEGHENNQWSDMSQLPSIQEIVNKINQKRYIVGVNQINSGYGFMIPNFAPPCFDYYIELEKIGGNVYPSEGNEQGRTNYGTENQNSEPLSTFNENEVRYKIADMQLGNNYLFYKKNENSDNDTKEAVRRWESGIRVRNIGNFERVILEGRGWTVVYKGTVRIVDGNDIQLTSN